MVDFTCSSAIKFVITISYVLKMNKEMKQAFNESRL